MKKEFLIFEIDGQNYGIDVACVKQILPSDGNVDGNIRVWNLRKLFLLDESDTYKIVQLNTEQPMAIAVERICGITLVESEKCSIISGKTWIHPMFCGGFEYEDDIAIIIDITKIDALG